MEFSYRRANANAIGMTKSVNDGRGSAITRPAEC